jgi:hypothetical protein
MTLNTRNMGALKDCTQLDASKKIKIKLDKEGRILYVNNYFTELTKFKVHELILKDFEYLLSSDVPKLAKKIIYKLADQYNEFYFILKGKIVGEDCFWSLVKFMNQYDVEGNLKGYLVEMKMLPIATIEKIDNLYDILREIENNAGLEVAQKYFNGYLEERGFTFKDFIFNIVEIDEKKADKYFAIDIDAKPKKKKGWF